MVKILCIEDEAALRRDIVEELRENGFEAIEAEDGVVGLASIINHWPDLIISDISMPRMSGFGLLKWLQQRHPKCAQIPFIFMTAFADQANRDEATNLNSRDFLEKPIDFDFLIERVRWHLDQAPNGHAGTAEGAA